MGVTVIADVLADAGSRMDRAVEGAKDDFATVRTGRENPQLFQKILVDYYGSPTPLAQLASLETRQSVSTPRESSLSAPFEYLQPRSSASIPGNYSFPPSKSNPELASIKTIDIPRTGSPASMASRPPVAS